MKKHIITAMTVLLCASLIFTGCGGNSNSVKLDPEKPVTIEIWHYYNGAQKTAFDNLITEFNETVGLEQGIVAEGFGQGGISDLTDNLIDAANQKVGAAEVPNIFAAYADTAYELDQMGIVTDLDQYLTEKELAEYIPSYIEEGRMGKNNALKIFPTAKSTEIFILNKTDWDKFSKATGASLNDLATIEGVVKTAKAYYDWTDSLTPQVADDGKAFYGRDALANYFLIGCRQLGVEIFDVNEDEVTLNLNKEIIRKLWDNYYIPMVHGYFGAFGRFRTDDAKTGSIIAVVASSTGTTYFPDTVTNDTQSYPITPLVLPGPVFKGGENYAVQQGAGMVVAKSTPEEEYASTIFLKWFTDVERNLDFSIKSGYLPVKVEANDLSLLEKNFASDPDQPAMPDKVRESLQISMETCNTHKLYTSRAFPEGNAARNILEDSLAGKIKDDLNQISAMTAGGMSRKEAAASLCTDENFDQWYAEFSRELTETVSGDADR